MSPDNIDGLIVEVVKWLEKEGCCLDFDDDDLYDRFSDLFYEELEPLCTRDRNYN